MDEGRPIFLSHMLLDGLMKRLDQQPGDKDASDLLRGEELLNQMRQSRDVDMEEWSDWQSYQPYLQDRRPPMRPSSARRRYGPDLPGARGVFMRAEDEPKRPNTARDTLHRMKTENASRMRRRQRVGLTSRRMEADAVLAALRHQQDAIKANAKVADRAQAESEKHRKQAEVPAPYRQQARAAKGYAGAKPHSAGPARQPPKQVDTEERRRKLQDVWEDALVDGPTLRKSSTGGDMRPAKPTEARPQRPARPMSAPLGGRGARR